MPRIKYKVTLTGGEDSHWKKSRLGSSFHVAPQREGSDAGLAA